MNYRWLAVGILVLVLAVPVSAASIAIDSTYALTLTETDDDTFYVMRAAPGDTAAAGVYLYVEWYNSTVPDTFLYARRAGVTWDTSTVPDDAIITDAKIGVFGSSKNRNTSEMPEAALSIVNFTPSDKLGYVGTDYSSTGYVRMGDDMPFGTFSTTAYKNLTLNGAGISEIDLTGLTSYLFTTVYDTDNTTLNWTPTYLAMDLTRNGSATPPKLYLEYTIPPVAAFSCTPALGLSPLSVTCTDTSTNDPAGWSWYYSKDGAEDVLFNATSGTPIQSFTNGTYSIKLNASNAAGYSWKNETDYLYAYGFLHPRTGDVLTSPGYLNNATEPWKTLEANILTRATTGMGYDFTAPSDRYSYINAREAMALATMYQISGNTTYANQSIDALLNLRADWNVTYESNINPPTGQPENQRALKYYLGAYDRIWQTVGTNSTLDFTNNSIIRENLGWAANRSYYRAPEVEHVEAFTLYFGVGESAIVLEDYLNTTHLSTPANLDNWVNMGYSELFENDTLHNTLSTPYATLNKGYFGYGIINMEDGRPTIGGYYNYYTVDLFDWLQIYNHTYSINLLETVPRLKAFAMNPVWTAMPNYYMSNIVASGQDRDYSARMAYSLLDEANRSYLMQQVETSASTTLLPHSSLLWDANTYQPMDLYAWFGNYTGESPSRPARLNSLDTLYNYQTIRGDWTNNSDWLQLVTWQQIFETQTRSANHGDQLAFDFYSKGDLLMMDGGEIQGFIPWYGTTKSKESSLHNTLMITNNSYPRGKYSNLTERGIYKGDIYLRPEFTGSNYPTTNATVELIIETGSVTYIKSNATITYVLNESSGVGWDYEPNYTVLYPNIEYTREVMYPFGDYPTIFDRATSDGVQGYTNVFRFGSLVINASTSPYTTLSHLGDVTGDLSIEGTEIEWRAVPFLAEIDPSTEANYVDWNTTNPYGDPVRLKLFTSPKTPVTYQKSISSIGGSTTATEVANPNVYFKQPSNTTLYRVTALLSRYENETPRTPSDLPVTGTGSAIKVISADTVNTDRIYTGLGNSTFDTYNTDADTAFTRTEENITGFLLINGSHLFKGELPKFLSEDVLNYVVYNSTGGNATVNVSGVDKTSSNLSFYGVAGVTEVYVDGVLDEGEGWDETDGVLTIEGVTFGESEVTIEFDGDVGEGEPDTTPPASVTNLTLEIINCTSLYAHWDNPTDEDYAGAMLNVNGSYENIIDAPAHEYTIPDDGVLEYLTEGLLYNISIRTFDTPIGNINLTYVYAENTTPACASCPVCSFTSDRFVTKIPQPLTVNGTCTNESTFFNWSFGDGTANVTTNNATHMYQRTGYFTVSFTCGNVAGEDSCESNIWVQNPLYQFAVKESEYKSCNIMSFSSSRELTENEYDMTLEKMMKICERYISFDSN